jgi:phage terminase Nu1 subunit (DNA packaging protein)
MAINPEQERIFVSRLEEMGVTLVRSDYEQGKISPHWVQVTTTWLAKKDREAEARREASNVEQIEIARRASEAAERAASEAALASAATERQATAAAKANTRATIALIISLISIIATVAGIWITHLGAHK